MSSPDRTPGGGATLEEALKKAFRASGGEISLEELNADSETVQQLEDFMNAGQRSTITVGEQESTG